MKRIFLLFVLLILVCVPACADQILQQDPTGTIILREDGNIDFLPADDSSAALTPQSVQTAVPPSAVLQPPEDTLQYGDSGEHVLAAQEQLTALGYYHGKCSGRFLEGTQYAARRFQKFNGLRETGKIDSTTWAQLFSDSAIARDGSAPYATASPVPTPTPTPPPFAFKRVLKYGESGDDVSALQTRLAELGFYDAKVSGGYYKVTRAAVRDFQAHNGLFSDGIAGKETQEMLFSADALPVSAVPRPSPTPIPPKYTLMVDTANQITRAYTLDENGEYTVLVREMICSTGTEKNPTPLGTTIMPKRRARWGYFPAWGSHAQYLTRIDSLNAFHSVLYSEPDETTLSTKSFDMLGRPASHGCVRLLVSDAKWIYENCPEGTIITVYEGPYDPEYTMTLKPTLNYSTLRENPLPKPTPTPTYSKENWPVQYRTLSRGKSGDDVFMLQMRLAELGYYHGSITGGYYGGTIKAVEAFQRDHGLSVDGAAGKATQALLFSDELTPSASPAPTAHPTAMPTATLFMTPTPEPAKTPDPALFKPISDSVG